MPPSGPGSKLGRMPPSRLLSGCGALLFLAVAIGCGRRAGDDVPARIDRLQKACEVAARVDDGLQAAPGGPAEAADALRALDRLAAAEGEWDAFRAWAGGRGKPETTAGLDRAWGEYQAALAALRAHLGKWAGADPAADQPGLDAKRTEDYVNLHNRLAAACDGLAQWAARVSPADLTSSPGRPPSSPAP